MYKTRVILTVDTEPSVAGAMEDRTPRLTPLLDEPVWGEVNGRSEALGFITRTLSSYNLKASFFVETLHARYFGSDAMRRYTDHLMATEQDVQLHIHPVWRNFSQSDAVNSAYDDDSASMDESGLTALISEGSELMEAWTGVRPVAMRTGNFSASLTVYRAMYKAGLKLASNICIACAKYQDHELMHAGGAHIVEGVTELPVASFIDQGPVGRGRYRPAQITACTVSELIRIFNQCHAQSIDTVVVVTHPFEFIKKSDFRYQSITPNRLVQRRFDRLCRFLANNSDRFQVATFDSLAQELPLPLAAAPTLNSTAILSIGRAIQNFINDRT